MKKLILAMMLATATTATADVEDLVWTCSHPDGRQATLTAQLEYGSHGHVGMEDLVLQYQITSTSSIGEVFPMSEMFNNRDEAAAKIEKEDGSAFGRIILGYTDNGTPYTKGTMLFSAVRHELIVFNYDTSEEFYYSGCKRN